MLLWLNHICTSGADTDILKGGAKNNNLFKIFRSCPQNVRDRVQMAAEKPVFDIFGVFFIVNFMIDPSLRGLCWLGGGARSVFVLNKPIFLG